MNLSIPIYKAEAEAGLADIIQSSSVIHIQANLSVLEKPDSVIVDLIKTKADNNIEQFDLFYMESVLASVGWNLNDDVFGKMETWAARNTPVHKPFNFMHQQTDIIGHIVSSKVLDFESNVVTANVLDEVPDKFDVIVGSVIYRYWSDEDKMSAIANLIEEIKAGDWCVSMECLFPNFDYALADENGNQKIIVRNESTAFLTKYLRAFKGTGQYNNYKVGRYLRNFAFSGKGLVKRPGNPRSVILNKEVADFKPISEEIIMPDTTNTVSYSQAQYDAVLRELNEAKAEAKKAVEAEVATLKNKVTELTTANETVANDLKASKDVLKVKEEAYADLQKKFDEVSAELSEANKTIANIKLETVKANRRAKLLTKVDDARADELIEKFATASEEMFEALFSALPTKAQCDDKMGDEEMKKKEDKKKSAKAEEEVEVEDDLNNAKADEEPSFAAGEEDLSSMLVSKAAEWFKVVSENK